MRIAAAYAAAYAAVLTLCCAAPGYAHWTQFRNSPTNNAVVRGGLKVQWEVLTDGRISASPAFTGGVVFIGTNAGTLYAIRANSGQVVWKQHASRALMSAPLVYRSLVIVGEGNAGTPGAILAYDRATGVLRWRTRLRGTGMPTPAIIDGILVHHDGSGRITGMDPMTGRRLYDRDLHSIASMSAALPLGNGTFVTSGVRFNAVVDVDAHTGRVIWRQDAFPQNASGIGDCPMASDGKRLFGDYVAPDRRAGRMQVGSAVREHAYALDVRTGRLLWDMPLQRGTLPIRNQAGIPVVKSGIVYVGGAISPWIDAVDARTGRILWKKQTYGAVKGAFTVRRGVLYFGDISGYLWALDARTGRKIGVKPMPTSFNVGSPIIIGKTLVIGSFTGSVYAVPLQAIRSGAP